MILKTFMDRLYKIRLFFFVNFTQFEKYTYPFPHLEIKTLEYDFYNFFSSLHYINEETCSLPRGIKK